MAARVKRLSLLDEPLFRVASAGSSARLTLPEVLARLAAGDDLVFVALRPHQEAAWHAFLVQLAFLALEAAGWPAVPTDPTDPAGWRRLLRLLSTQWPSDEPWHLEVDDWRMPAFLQSPGSPADYREAGGSAQELDLLVTSKNHDEKIGKLQMRADDAVDVWVYALVSLQGFAGFLGRGNYSTMRMNGGFASRPQFRLVFTEGSGAEFVRDLAALREHAATLWHNAADMGMGTTADAARLLWLEPWAAAPLPLAKVHPLCLEVTRRVRLRSDADGALRVWTAPSTSMRVAAKDNKGLVLDPWIPVMKDGEPRALTAQADTFQYHRLAPLLFDRSRSELPALALPTDDELDADAPAVLRMQVLVGGSGRTDGYLRRELPMPPPVLQRFARDRDQLAVRARAFVELASVAQGKVLRAALLQYVDGSDEVDWQNKDFGKAVSPWVAVLERRIDDAFFETLFATLGEPPLGAAAARSRWAGVLRALVRGVFDAAVASLPTRDRSREFARGRAERLLRNAMRLHLADEEPVNADANARAGGRRGPSTGRRAAPPAA